MSMTGLSAFDTTIQNTNIWLKDIMEELNWTDRHKAYLALRNTLHAVRDRLLVDEAVEFAAQFPMLLRGLYFEGWDPSKTPDKGENKEVFLQRVCKYFETDPDFDTEKVAKAIFKVLDNKITAGEINDVRGILPKKIRELWPEPAHVE